MVSVDSRSFLRNVSDFSGRAGGEARGQAASVCKVEIGVKFVVSVRVGVTPTPSDWVKNTHRWGRKCEKAGGTGTRHATSHDSLSVARGRRWAVGTSESESESSEWQAASCGCTSELGASTSSRRTAEEAAAAQADVSVGKDPLGLQLQCSFGCSEDTLFLEDAQTEQGAARPVEHQ